MNILTLFLNLFIFNYVSALDIQLYAKDLISSSINQFGLISYDYDSNDYRYTATFVKNDNFKISETSNGGFCIGIIDNSDNFKCQSIAKLGYPLNGEITLTTLNDGSIKHIDYSPYNHIPQSSKNKIKPKSITKDENKDEKDKINVRISISKKSITPPLKNKIKLIDNKEPEPEVPKSFIQKYWMFLTIPLVLMTLGGGAGE